MINNVTVGGYIFAIDTDTSKVTRNRELGYKYVRGKFFVEKAGKFIFPEKYNLNPIDVEAGDLIIVFEPIDDNYKYVKTNLKDALSIMNDLDEYKKNRSSNSCDSDTCGIVVNA